MEIVIQKSQAKGKKFAAIITENSKKKTVNFGAEGMSDYTIHKDEERKQRYIKRHLKSEDWRDFKSAGFYSRYVLWEKPTLKEAIENIKQKFGLNIKLNL